MTLRRLCPLQKSMVEEGVKLHPLLCVAPQQPHEQVCELVGSTGWNLWGQVGVPFVEHLQLLRRVGLEWCLPGETLENNGPQ